MINPEHPRIRRALLQRLDNGDFITFLINPDQVQSAISVSYSQKPTIGGSRQRLQYQYTSNPTFSLSAVFSRYVHFERNMSGAQFSTTDIDSMIKGFEDYRRFLLSLCYPAGAVNDPLRKAPPIALFVWPGFIAIKVVVRSLSFTDTQFDTKLRPVVFTAAMQLEEFRRYRLTADDAKKTGFVRASIPEATGPDKDF